MLLSVGKLQTLICCLILILHVLKSEDAHFTPDHHTVVAKWTVGQTQISSLYSRFRSRDYSSQWIDTNVLKRLWHS